MIATLQCALMFVLLSVLLAAAAQMARAQTETVLYSFCSQPNCADGAYPIGGLVRDGKGNLYGTTPYGGSGCCGNGTVFEVTASGTEKVLYTFTGGADGGFPEGGLIQHGANLYGTTNGGGAFGQGAVFVVTTKGKESVLYSFAGGEDGAFPTSGLVRDKLGNLYGTTSGGGAFGFGTVFELAPTGIETVLYSFGGGADGVGPYAGVVFDKKGNLYGTTYYGGLRGCSPDACGTVFEVTSGGTHKVLYSFTGGTDGAGPYGGVMLDSKGNLYGTTLAGGANLQACGGGAGCGTVFEVTEAGAEKVIYSFCSQPGCADGWYSRAVLVRDTHGNLYGTTALGGSGDNGTVFEVSPTGTLTVLYTFTGGADGGASLAGLVRDKLGNLYGTTNAGGAYGSGTVFKVVP